MSIAGLQITEAKTEREKREFIMFPFQLYKNDPNWVAPLIGDRVAMFDPQKNPTFQHMEAAFFVARGTKNANTRKSEIVGTVAAIVNRRHNEFHDEQVGFFGFFETINDSEVAELLLETAAAWVKERGMTALRGPVSFTTNDECGLLVEGFDAPPLVMMTYNPSYYVTLIENAGFVKAMDLLAYDMDFGESRDIKKFPPKVQRVVEKVRKRGEVTVRPFNMKKFDQEVANFKEIYNRAWTKNWGFVPMTDAEIDHLTKQLKQAIDPVLIWIAEANEGPDKGKPVGVGLSIPDVNVVLKQMGGRVNPITILKALWYQRKIKRIRTLVLGVVEGWRGRGVDALLFYETARAGLNKGYQGGEGSWILENNEMMNRSMQMMGGVVYKRYRIYEKPVG